MKYIKKFETEAEKKNWQKSDNYVLPNVCLTERVVTYNEEKAAPPPNGVYIQHINGELYIAEQWSATGFANDLATGVAVLDDDARFVIAKEDISVNKLWSSKLGFLVEGILTTTDSDTAKTDFRGNQNTELMLATDTSEAAFSCANYVFPNGHRGYLPSLGEWMVVSKYGLDVRAALTLIGGKPWASGGYYWSSTQVSAGSAWEYLVNSRLVQSQTKNSSRYLRPFLKLEL
jgi:hypothetical protein